MTFENAESIKLTKAILKEVKLLARQVNPEIAKDLERIADDVTDLAAMVATDLSDAFDLGWEENFEDAPISNGDDDWEPEDEKGGHC